jgi:Uma2 family endonuclease
MTTLLQKDRPPFVDREGSALWIPREAAGTLAGFRAWYASDTFPEEGRISYLDGEIFIDLGHERLSSHVALKSDLAEALVALAKELNVGRFLTDGCRVVSEDGNLSSEPDGVYFTWAAVKAGRVKLQRSADGGDWAEFVGPPEMVLEIVSPSSVRKDTKVLPDVYRRTGIPEYWLIDARSDDLSFSLFRLTPDGYVAAESRDGWLRSAVFGREFRLERTQDPVGMWQYRLEVRTPT